MLSSLLCALFVFQTNLLHHTWTNFPLEASLALASFPQSWLSSGLCYSLFSLVFSIMMTAAWGNLVKISFNAEIANPIYICNIWRRNNDLLHLVKRTWMLQILTETLRCSQQYQANVNLKSWWVTHLWHGRGGSGAAPPPSAAPPAWSKPPGGRGRAAWRSSSAACTGWSPGWRCPSWSRLEAFRQTELWPHCYLSWVLVNGSVSN